MVQLRERRLQRFWRQTALVVPSILLVLYLGFQARRNVRKLSHRKSYVMIAYYALLWFTALLNLAWAILQAWQCAPGKTIAWNLLSLFTECGLLTLEISILAFLLQENYASGLEALAHTFMVSGSFVAIDMLIQNEFLGHRCSNILAYNIGVGMSLLIVGFVIFVKGAYSA
ncbi:UNVERIFIED_CONTAM: protein CANDIDATE G-PROTEIN COUPLED RECEPTOR 2 [Sesamum radiatum]|uniref:Protein CANDIDATE G-PROTEIN COUPLED RECEPTOR 2 n=1 Tax=Sesamum radiatum TaxID=300843 RepID=A0AAW2PKC1_SESRA